MDDTKIIVEPLLYYVNMKSFSKAEFYELAGLLRIESEDLHPDTIQEELLILDRFHPDVREFFQGMVSGRVLIPFLNKIYEVLRVHGDLRVKFVETGIKWYPLKMFESRPVCFAHMLFQGIFVLFDNGLADVFERLRKCDFCDNYFIPKTDRGIFCCDSHRVRSHQKKMKSKNEAPESRKPTSRG